MKKIKSMTINGKAVKICKLGGGIMYSNTSTYEELEYLESTGAQYLLLSHINNIQNTRKEFAMMYTSANLAQSVSGAEYANAWDGNIYDNCFYVGSSAFTGLFTASRNVKHTVIISINNQTKNVSIVLDDKTYNKQYNGNAVSNVRYAVFADNQNNVIRYYLNGRIYYWRLFQDDVLSANLLPARRIADQKLGMYDTVTKQFFTNQGTGKDFTAGNPTGRKF